MKFKMQDKQNQQIERISIKHLIVGIDIAQQLHVARSVNFRGIVIGDPITFENRHGTNRTLLGKPFKMAL
jgi:transposase